MDRRHLAMLLALAAIWGSSFMFIKVAVEEVSPGVVVWGRVLVASLALLPAIPLIIGWRRLLEGLRRYAWPLIVLGVFNASIPFWLLAWGEERLDSGLAAVLQASTPLFTALLAFGFSRSNRVTGVKLAGVVIGFLGVVLLVGVQPEGDVLSALAVVGSALCYAASALYAAARLRQTPPIVASFGTLLVATIATAPLGLAQLPGSAPSWEAIVSIVVLGAAGLSIAYLLYFGLIAGAGASYAVLVTYLVPALALGYGAVFLDEAITASALGGLALILAGVGLGTGTLKLSRRTPVGETP
jgi:drug/metabolite transporter (DMT)-like permease